MMEVARHPEVLREIQKEIDAVGLYTDQPFQIDDLAQLVYLDQVIKEGMRLWPVAAHGAGRKAETDYKYKDMVIPKGCSISVYFIIMFRLGIQNPNAFDPSRWNKDSPDLPALTEMFMPFGLGKRNCPGQSLAMMEMRMILCHFYRYFEFEMVDKGEIQTEYFLTLKPKNSEMR
eukprot:gene3913-4909_t